MLIKFELPNNIKIIPFELKLRRNKWLFVSIYKPVLQNNQCFFSILSDLMGFYNKVVLGDCNLEPSSNSMLFFMDNKSFVSLIKNGMV